MNWRIEDLKAYTQRRLRQEERARERMHAKGIRSGKKWCAWCGVWGNHTSGSCPDLCKQTGNPKPITEAQFQALAKAKTEACPWCKLPVEKVSEPAGSQTWYFYRHSPDAPKCQGMWTVMEEKP